MWPFPQLPSLSLLTVFTLVSCGSGAAPPKDRDTSTADSDTPDDTDTDTNTTDTGTDPTSFTEDPAVSPNPEPCAPLVRVLTAITSQPTRLQITLTSAMHTVELRFEELSVAHDHNILGLHADTAYDAIITAVPEAGAPIEYGPIPVITAPLPNNLPWFEVKVSDAARMEPGVTLFWAASSGVDGFLIAIDAPGEVVWFCEQPRLYQELHRHSNGAMQATYRATPAYPVHNVAQFQMTGQELVRFAPAQWASGTDIVVDVPAFHHDVQEGPDDTFFALSIEERQVADYPTSETDPYSPRAPATLAADVVVQVALDGSIVDRWSLLDLLDPERIGYDSVIADHWRDWYGPGTKDWAHANAAFYDWAEDDLVVSLRHQDAVVSIDRTTHELNWILGPHANWEAQWQPYLLDPVRAPFGWAYHQHASMVTPSGNILLFDNGNNRASAYETRLADQDNQSRAVEFKVDPVAMTVEQVWHYGTEPSTYSGAMGDADWMPTTGNVLIDFGYIKDADRTYGVRAIEVTHTDPAEVVFELVLGRDAQMYRIDRMPSLYADGVLSD